jgi:hypothetical protein
MPNGLQICKLSVYLLCFLFFVLRCSVGIELPKIEVRYENLNVEAEAYVGSRGLPTLLNTYANVLEVCRLQ